MRLNEINTTKRALITEGWNDPRLTLLETTHLIPFITSIENYIVEANLTPQQINQMFTDVEAGATAAGGNRTGIGKGVDAAKFVNNKMKELGQAVKKSGPVSNADQKFNDLKTKIGAKDSKVVKAVQAVSDWAKENPGKATIGVAILTIAAGMAAGPMAGAIGGFLARASKDLLQGKDLSSAVGNSLKTAAIGAIVGVVADGIDFGAPDVEGGVNTLSGDVDTSQLQDKIAAELGDTGDAANQSVASAFADMDVSQFKMKYAEEMYLAQLEKFGGEASRSMMIKMAENIDIQGTYPDSFSANFDGSFVRGNIFLTPDEARELSAAGFEGMDIMGDEATEWIKTNVEGADEQIQAGIDASARADAELKTKYDAMSPEEQEAFDDKRRDMEAMWGEPGDYTPPGTPKYKESINFKNIQIETIIEWCDQSPAVILTEGPLDAIKKGAAAAGGALKKGAAAVGAKAKTVGKNLSSKITADKLNKAWIKAGKPTDSNEIANILRQQGVSDQVLAPVYKTLGAKLPPAPVAADPKAPGAAAPGAAPGAKPGPGGKPAQAAAPVEPGAKAAPGGKPAAPGQSEPAMDFKTVQQAVAKLGPEDAKSLVTHIDSLAAAPQTAPTADGNAAADATAPAEKDPAKNAAAGDTYEKAKGDIRKVQGGQKPMPPKTAATIASDLAKLAKGDKESGVAAAQKIMTFAKAGVDVSKQQQAWVANSKAGERFLTQSIYFEISRMLKENNLRWSDLGLRVHLLEGTNQMFGLSYV
ncbi:hypothetical protein N9827_00075 [bacterium]|nr:hypothetical protein [bacterium]